MKDFDNLIDMITTLGDEATCSQYIAQKRWGDTPVCPHCGNNEKVYMFSDKIRYKCGKCRRQFTVRVGTIFEDSKVPLFKWFVAIYLFTNTSKGISSLQLARHIKVTQKTAWFMLQRLRHATANEDFKKPLSNTVEADETYIGGREKNRHEHKKQAGRQGGKTDDKTAVLGIVERGGHVRAHALPEARKEHVQPIIIKNVKEFTRVMTDEWYGYNGLQRHNFDHSTVKHLLKQYVDGDVHTNTIENFWSCLKRGIYGIYHFTSKKHLQRYLEEFAYRYNYRQLSNSQRVNLLLQQSDIGHLEYKKLTAD